MIRRKRTILICAAFVCLVFSLWLSVWQFSADNIQNLLEDQQTVTYPAGQLTTTGWDETEFGLMSVEENPTVTVQGEAPVYVRNILIDGSLDREITKVTVEYTESADEPFTGEKRFAAPVEIKNKDTYLTIDRTVVGMRLELCEGIGCELNLEKIVLNPRNLNVNYQTLVLAFFVPFVVVLFVLELICEREGFRKTFSSLRQYRPFQPLPG